MAMASSGCSPSSGSASIPGPTGPCRRILVANRGEIARRVMATARAMGIETVAVYAADDAEAPFVLEADRAVALHGSGAAGTYLDQAQILAAAAATGADAVHPGYGFLSENAGFAAAVVEAGLTWIGPAPAAIAAMGDKLAAKTTVSGVGVPVLASVEVDDTVDVATAAKEIGYPVLVKAAAGGGGKGMRVVEQPEDLADAVAGAQREAASSFGDGTVFLERYLAAPRHVEIQVVADTHGTTVHAFERECSIQRRHQKIIEEAPSPAVDAELRARMGAAAVAAVSAIDYHSVGTVEFLLDGDAFYFLEVNTRLQVEHPVTEEVTGLDLVREQVRIARGEPLGYTQDDLSITGHAIEARLYAEDVPAGFLPATGTLRAFDLPADPPSRLDSGVAAGSVVGVAFDPMLAKVTVAAPTREEAAARLALVLDRAVIAGVTTNRPLLVDILRHPAFLAGDTTTDFIDRTGVAGPGDREATTGGSAPARDRLLAAVVVARRQRTHRAAPALAFLPAGYRNSVMPPQSADFDLDGEPVTVRWRSRPGGGLIVDPGTGRDEADWLEVVAMPGPAGDGPEDRLDLVIDGTRARYVVVGDGRHWHAQGPDGRLDAVEQARFPDPADQVVAGSQTAPMPGTVRVVAVTVGERVTAGQTLVVMEAMKMEHTVVAATDGEVTEVSCTEGQQVAAGDVLVVVAADE
ncbi:MAG: acetyl/propionyl/methylcrotonyl-CoA carboxylase subunit alpha [Acidimicrobiales bacterium]